MVDSMQLSRNHWLKIAEIVVAAGLPLPGGRTLPGRRRPAVEAVRALPGRFPELWGVKGLGKGRRILGQGLNVKFKARSENRRTRAPDACSNHAFGAPWRDMNFATL